VTVTCLDCHQHFDDIYRDTRCPHETFRCSPPAARLLREQGIDPGPAFTEAEWNEVCTSARAEQTTLALRTDRG
jgi:predicted DNA-binding protein (MmcQ/YjbR family)